MKLSILASSERHKRSKTGPHCHQKAIQEKKTAQVELNIAIRVAAFLRQFPKFVRTRKKIIKTTVSVTVN